MNDAKEITLTVEGMTCAACSSAVDRALQKVEGISSSNVSLANEEAYVSFDETITNIEELVRVVDELGYKASLSAKESVFDKTEEDEREQKHNKILKVKLITAVIFSLPIFLITVLDTQFEYSIYLLLVLASVVQFFPGLHFIKPAVKKARHLKANMDTLVVLGTFSAYIYSVFVSLSIIEGYIYFEASSVVITLVLLGKYLESIAKRKTKDAIQKLIKLQPKDALVIRENKEITVPIEKIKLDDIVIIRPGERLPVDGIVDFGNSYIDKSALTGESIPVYVEKGDEVHSGSLNQSGGFRLIAKKVGSQTMLARMIELVKEALRDKTQIERFADRVSAVFVPIVLIIAATTFAVWYMLLSFDLVALQIGSTVLGEALINTVAVLVIACPCAMGLATPAAIIVGTGKGAGQGILIKNAAVLEETYKIDTVVFDKTGTLTTGKPSVSDIIIMDEAVDEAKLIELAYSLEKLSEHPLAKAIIDKAHSMNIQNNTEVQSFKVFSGKGVSGIIDDNKIALGNIKMMAEEANISFDERVTTLVNKLSSKGKSIMLIAKNRELIGIIALFDELRERSIESIRKLKELGITNVILSGDMKEACNSIGDKLKIDKIVAELMPDEKIGYIKELQKDNKAVAMVGDGINDAPALAQANIGIALGGGTDIAIEASDITLVNNNIEAVPTAINLSKKTMRTIKINLFWAFFYNIIGIPFAAFGLLNPMIAGLAMAFSSVSVLGNSLLLKKAKI